MLLVCCSFCVVGQMMVWFGVAVFIEQVVSYACRCSGGQAAIHGAAAGGYTSMVEFLAKASVMKGADVNVVDK
jgi:hypothetical protein